MDSKTFDYGPEIDDSEAYENLPSLGFIHGSFFNVDSLLAKPISLLNKKGYLTATCCQGHVPKQINPVIVLRKDSPIFAHRKQRDNLLKIDDDGNYHFQDAISGYILFDAKYELMSLPKGFTFYPKHEFKHIVWNISLSKKNNGEIVALSHQELYDCICKASIGLLEWVEKLSVNNALSVNNKPLQGDDGGNTR